MQQSIKLKTFLQTADQAKKKVIDFFKGSSSTYRNSIYYLFAINDKVDVYGYADLDKAPEYCKSKAELNTDCKCDATSTSYTIAQCQKDKLCLTDLIRQDAIDCPCLSTGDPRANGTCPAYCVKGNLTSNCTCDSNLPNYSVGQCQIDKACKYDLIHQSNATCPCLSTADPRAGGACPEYCIRGYATSDCICDTNIPSYPVESCQREKKCQFELINQNTSDCPCLATGDPRAGGVCPAYCIKGQVTSECICDYYIPDFTIAQCQTEKKCKFDLADQTNATCPCLSTGDPRAGYGQCPAYCTAIDQPSQSCVCDSNPTAQYPPSLCQSEKKCNVSSNSTVTKDSCTCSGSNHPTGCKCPTDSSQLNGIPQNRCECLKTGDPRANGICPAYCVKGKVNANCECDTNSSSFPLSSCQTEKKCITDLINQNNITCPCLSTGDPRAGNTCPAYCIKGQVTANCTCNTNVTGYTVDQCQKEKLCFADLVNQPNSTCPCLPTGDPRAGNGQCPAYCIKDQVNQSCVCDTNIPGYTVAQCQIEYQCKYNLANQIASDCPCLSIGDPRAGYGQCPDYCTAKDTPTSDCICDSNPSAQYPPSSCNSEKQCNVSSSSTVTKDSCTCSGSNHPTGCRCPSETTHLTGIPINQCECRSSGDPRAGNACPVYCVNGQVNSSCVCDLNDNSFPYTTCERDKACSIDLIHQNNITCPCLSTGDPRAGLGQCSAYCIKGNANTTCACDTGSTFFPVEQCNIDKLCITDLIHQSITDCPCVLKSDPRAGSICPQYCKSKDELTLNCVCEYESTIYPQATCEIDKLCLVDLIHQSTSNCPCLKVDDPRGESICKPSDPDPSDPIIPDPSEKDPETEQEQGSGSKQDEEEKEKQKEESTSIKMTWIIIIVVAGNQKQEDINLEIKRKN
ncbi:MAG: hypothetical protein EZS28_018457 [Streblomastix strix]|uniref:EGF-like domain-containing protein n=1 Tax=Streblomastix strix TaxID=222440 RepID=A0A5J4VUA9_9EUKA|nr:MAG: hypothetical protein EZS28_018457 [Streblomastix strix]